MPRSCKIICNLISLKMASNLSCSHTESENDFSAEDSDYVLENEPENQEIYSEDEQDKSGLDSDIERGIPPKNVKQMRKNPFKRHKNAVIRSSPYDQTNSKSLKNMKGKLSHLFHKYVIYFSVINI